MVRSPRAYERRIFSAYGLLVLAGCTVIPDVNPAASSADDEGTQTSNRPIATEPTMPSMSAPPSSGESSSASGSDASPPFQNAAGSAVPAGGVSGGAMSGAAGTSSLAGSSAAGAGEVSAAGLGFGVECGADSQCASSQCVKGRCCGVRDCGACQRCGDDGQCQKIVGEPDPYTCDANVGTCDAAGKCSLKNGAACYATTSTCASGHCDKFCCAVACGTCARCRSAGDACEPVMFEDDEGTCSGEQSCSNGACVDVVIGAILQGPERTVAPGEELAQVFWPQRDGTLVEIRLETGCRELPLVLRTADAATEMPEADVLRMLQPRPAKPDDFLVSYPVSPGLKITQADRFAFVLQNTGAASCPSSYSNTVSMGSPKLYARNGASAAWTELRGSALSYKVLAAP